MHNQEFEPAFAQSPLLSLTADMPRGRGPFLCLSKGRGAGPPAVSRAGGCILLASACLPFGPASVDVTPTRIQQPEPTRSYAILTPSRPGRRSFSLRYSAALRHRFVLAGVLVPDFILPTDTDTDIDTNTRMYVLVRLCRLRAGNRITANEHAV